MVKTQDGTMPQDYENHYSARLNKCFYLQTSNHVSKTNDFKSLQQYELNEHTQYGSFTSGIGGGTRSPMSHGAGMTRAGEAVLGGLMTQS
jgi:hypothetical protein